MAEVSSSYARNDVEQTLFNTSVTGLRNDLDRDSVFAIEAAELKADGSLFSLPGGSVRAAVGIGYRGESYEDRSRNLRTNALTQDFDVDQAIRSAFGEVYVPLVGADNAFTGVNRLELSVAGRYDDYSTAGSSFDPQVGLMWEPVGGLRLRGRYSTSYKAPNLVDYSTVGNFGQVASIPVPGSATPQVVMPVGGIDVASLRPQESENSSFGLEISPESLPGFDFAINYYKIRYSGLIATPANGNALVVLANPAAYQNLIIVDPSVDVVNQYIAIAGAGFLSSIPNFTPDLVDIIVDVRRRNLSVVRAEGLDLATNYNVKVGESHLTFGLSGTYILNQEQQVTRTSPEIETVDTIFNPPDWRARGFVSWQMKGWAANVFVNHTDAYVDNRLQVRPTVGSYTTVDTRIAFDFSNRFSSGALSGLTIALNAQNVLDRDPPRVSIISANSAEAGFDATNADPLGRFISLEITKVW